MKHRLFRFHFFMFKWRYLCSEEFLALLLAMFIFVAPVAAATRLQDRSLLMQTNQPGATTNWTVSFQYVSPPAIGSVDMLFCQDPIPYDPCVAPAGLDVSRAVLSAQTGETGFSISTQTTNHIVLSRAASVVTNPISSYILQNVVNPTDPNQSFAIRLQTHMSTDASGPQVDFGSVEGQVTNAIVIQTQVPPMLVFCEAQEVDDNCTGTNNTYYSYMGTLSPSSTLTASSQLAVGTNASGGFAVTVNGSPPATGTNIIPALTAPTASVQGTNQFGINLVENSEPSVGSNPSGTWANALPTTDYSQANKYMFVPGDVVASSPNVSLMKKFTISYVLNSSKDLRAGVYSTTITFVASGRF